MSHAPAWCLAIVVVGLLQLNAAKNFDHHAGQLLVPPFTLSGLRRLLSVINASKVWPTPVRIHVLPRDAYTHKRCLCRRAVSVRLFVCHVRVFCHNE